MNRSYPSGSMKRKKKLEQEKCVKRLNIEKFLLRGSRDTSDTTQMPLQNAECIANAHVDVTSSNIMDNRTASAEPNDRKMSVPSALDYPLLIPRKSDSGEISNALDTLLLSQKQSSDNAAVSDVSDASVFANVASVCSLVSNDTNTFDYSDPALWPPVTDQLREYFIVNKPN